jgi:hypothetical protein
MQTVKTRHRQRQSLREKSEAARTTGQSVLIRNSALRS